MFLQQGIFESSYPLTDVKYVRLREESKENVRPTLDVITEQRDIHWMFPEAARQEDIDNLAAVLFNKPSEPRAIEQSIPLADATDFG